MENCAFKKLENWSSKFDYVVDSHSGYVDTFEKANEVIREFEISTTTTYASRFQTKDFGSKFYDNPLHHVEGEDIPSKVAGHKILWADPQGLSTGVVLAFDGILFQVLGRKIFDCQHGTDLNKAMKACNAAQFKV